jgi:hypothetical protein
MSTLQERLDRIRESFEGQAPGEALAVMHRATDDLRTSGIVERIPKLGDPLPAFELEDTEGHPVQSAGLLERGPLVITFYRGAW